MSAAPAVHSARSEIVCSRPVQRLPARSSTVISDCQASGCPVSMRTSYPCAPMTPASTCPRAPPPQIQNVYGFVGSFRSSGIRSKSIAFIVFWFCTVSAMKAPCGSVSAPKMRMNGFIADFRSDYAAQPEISGRQPVMYVVVCLTNFPPPSGFVRGMVRRFGPVEQVVHAACEADVVQTQTYVIGEDAFVVRFAARARAAQHLAEFVERTERGEVAEALHVVRVVGEDLFERPAARARPGRPRAWP